MNTWWTMPAVVDYGVAVILLLWMLPDIARRDAGWRTRIRGVSKTALAVVLIVANYGDLIKTLG